MRFYYLTRSWLPELTGGILIRKGAVDLLIKKGFDVTVITPDYKNISYDEQGYSVMRFPFNRKLTRPYLWLERLGILEDYLDLWVNKTYSQLKDKINKNDVVFSTSGGELGTIKLGSKLKSYTGCKFIVNFHDPLDYSKVNGLIMDNKFHVSREKKEKKYLSNSDLIITSSKTNRDALKGKYPEFKNKIKNNYFGYIKPINLIKKEKSEKLRIAYVGRFGGNQKPEIFLNAVDKVNDIKVTLIGNYENYKNIKNYIDKYDFIKSMPHEKFLEFMQKHVDVGFVSLATDYLGACVPSKIYEYINLGLPIIAALPNGDAMRLINENNYGIACDYNDEACIVKAIQTFKNTNKIREYKSNVLKDKQEWSMENRIQEVIGWIKNLK